MKQFLRFYGAPIVIVLLGLLVAFLFMAPAPPKKVVIAGGAAGGAYAATAESYAKALRAQGVEVEVLSTAGSVDNLAKIKAKEADIGIVQTGLAADFGSAGVNSLGAVFYEPLWVFHRASAPINELQDIAGRRVAIGPEGSGVRALATLLLTEAGMTPDKYTASPLAGQAAAAALKAGEVDVALVVSGPTTGWIADLIADRDVALLSMREAHALARRHAYLDEVTLYRGVIDLAAILPREDVTLIAPAAQIAVREDLHPAIQSLLIEAAFREHGGGSLLADPGRFPTSELSDIAISDEAARYYKNGPSFMRRIFPYSVANFFERAWVLAIPLITLLIPLIRAAPPLYRWRIRRKIYVWYNDLRELEAAGRAAQTPEDRTEVRAKLADLQAETGNVEVPVSYTDDLYRLRAHIRFVAELLDKLAAQERHARI
ncbi:MAG TPA: TAXI family TRAP transporter solute-binding subunit [Hyphomonadaceae bacterium]|nr:TAXI family TRAP transporter solute-binding subunit [Hyphomonadaceae bacterium]HPI46745.1 TAXI family TRAP transporter solute-binding subunit [Hyphomonadaceae bacterium]